MSMTCRQKAVRRQGMALWPWLLILMLVISLALVLQYANRNLAMANQCREQMKRIYGALGFYEVQNGSLPAMRFYPEDPRKDEDSLRLVLEAYGLDPDDTICPSAQPLVRETGLSYLWNVNLNKQVLSAGRQSEWLMTEIEVMSSKLRGPHFRHYHVMYTDGHVQRTDTVPHEVPGTTWRD